MPQCTNYPNSCNGKVIRDNDDGSWYCKKHFSEYDRIRNKFVMVRGLKRYVKTSLKNASARRTERASDKAKIPPKPPGGRP